MNSPEPTLEVLVHHKGNDENERFVYIYDKQDIDPLLETFRRQLQDPELSFNEFDFKVMKYKLKLLKQIS
jgi:hypothetical protein